jgi:hypothetical protein
MGRFALYNSNVFRRCQLFLILALRFTEQISADYSTPSTSPVQALIRCNLTVSDARAHVLLLEMVLANGMQFPIKQNIWWFLLSIAGKGIIRSEPI